MFQTHQIIYGKMTSSQRENNQKVKQLKYVKTTLESTK